MAIVISQQDKRRVESAIARCKAEHPTVKQITATKYEVSSSKDKTQRYTVTWSGKGADMVADCTCKAGQKGQICKHVVACGGMMRETIRARAAARLHSLECSKCGEAFQTENSAAFFCPSCEEADRQAKVEKDFADIFGSLPVVNRLREVE